MYDVPPRSQVLVRCSLRDGSVLRSDVTPGVDSCMNVRTRVHEYGEVRRHRAAAVFLLKLPDNNKGIESATSSVRTRSGVACERGGWGCWKS